VHHRTRDLPSFRPRGIGDPYASNAIAYFTLRIRPSSWPVEKYPPYLHPSVTARGVLGDSAEGVQGFDKGRGPVGFAPIGQAL
jgi:hypothetical protein